jgi:hypothetical protein
MTIISAVLVAALAQTVATPGQHPAAAPAQVPVQPTPMPAQGGQQPARPAPLTRTELMNNLQGFNIVLLVGESQSSGPSIEDVPAAARKALADMKEFLPFKITGCSIRSGPHAARIPVGAGSRADCRE